VPLWNSAEVCTQVRSAATWIESCALHVLNWPRARSHHRTIISSLCSGIKLSGTLKIACADKNNQSSVPLQLWPGSILITSSLSLGRILQFPSYFSHCRDILLLSLSALPIIQCHLGQLSLGLTATDNCTLSNKKHSLHLRNKVSFETDHFGLCLVIRQFIVKYSLLLITNVNHYGIYFYILAFLFLSHYVTPILPLLWFSLMCGVKSFNCPIYDFWL
jgi:hypothetical protein